MIGASVEHGTTASDEQPAGAVLAQAGVGGDEPLQSRGMQARAGAEQQRAVQLAERLVDDRSAQ